MIDHFGMETKFIYNKELLLELMISQVIDILALTCEVT